MKTHDEALTIRTDSDDDEEGKGSDGDDEVGGSQGDSDEDGLNDGSSDEEVSDGKGELDGETGVDKGDGSDEGAGSDEEVKKDTGVRMFGTEEDLEREISQMRVDFNARKQPAGAGPPAKSTRSTPGPSVPKNKKAAGFDEVDAFDSAMIKTHARVCLTSLFGFKEAHDAAHTVFLYNDKGEPIWIKPGERIMIPHLDRSFQENFTAWGPKFYELVANFSRLEEEERLVLSSVPLERFCDTLPTGAFGSMVRAWKENRDGKGNEVREKKNRNSRRAGRKSQKGKRRLISLKRSGLPIKKFAFVADPEFQSSEHSDCDDKSHLTITTRECVAPEVSKPVDALDVNAKFKLSKGKKAPGWGIKSGWLESNPALGRASKPFIDTGLETMPNVNQVARFIHEHEPEGRVYVPATVSDDVFEPVPPAPLGNPAPALSLAPSVAPSTARSGPGSSNHPYYPSYTEQLAHYGLDQFAQPFAQDTQYGPFPDHGYGLPRPDYMLGDNDLVTAPEGQEDLLHPFNLQDGAAWDDIMAQVNNALAGSSDPLSVQPVDNPTPASASAIPPTLNDSSTPNAEIAAPVDKPAQTTRLSSWPRKATAKAMAAAEAAAAVAAEAEKLKSPDTIVLKPKFSKIGKKKAGKAGKGKGTGEKKGGERAKDGADEILVAGPSRVPFDAGKIKKFSFKKLRGE
ncbi:hypothetical protein FRC07_002710 [Ceratobasidium sp. 392]|nr:hypothetical protein FRC07_002710 [Ceratobasidium sp. 392]